MDRNSAYVARLMNTGYDECYARQVLRYFETEGSLEGLEEYLQAREEAIRG